MQKGVFSTWIRSVMVSKASKAEEGKSRRAGIGFGIGFRRSRVKSRSSSMEESDGRKEGFKARVLAVGNGKRVASHGNGEC